MIMRICPIEIKGIGMHWRFIERMSLSDASPGHIDEISCFSGEFLSVYIIIRLSLDNKGKIMETNS
jgi:hypothetical protein